MLNSGLEQIAKENSATENLNRSKASYVGIDYEKKLITLRTLETILEKNKTR